MKSKDAYQNTENITKMYESHNLEVQSLPVIFHYDPIQRKRPQVANWHENIEILYCMKGKGEVNCNSVLHTLEVGEMFVVNTGCLHSFQTDDIFEYYCLIVDSGFLRENGIVVEKMELEALIRSCEAVSLYENVIKEYESQDSYRVPAVRAAVLELMVYLVRNFCVGESAAGGTVRQDSSESIKRAISYIKANYDHKLTLEEVAGAVGISKYHFSREFKRATSMNFITFLNAVRCRNAKKLLDMKKYSVHEISRRCGFENDSYFSRTYKEMMGKLPSRE